MSFKIDTPATANTMWAPRIGGAAAAAETPEPFPSTGPIIPEMFPHCVPNQHVNLYPLVPSVLRISGDFIIIRACPADGGTSEVVRAFPRHNISSVTFNGKILTVDLRSPNKPCKFNVDAPLNYIMDVLSQSARSAWFK